jgi:predicted methyltransferase
MKVDDNPFPGDQNMVDARLFKGKAKVLTSTKSKEAWTVDPKMQISVDKYREIRRRRTKQKSQYEQGKTSKAETTSRILLNK